MISHLLDANFPLRFYTRLQRERFSVEHILLTRRGIHDREILVRLKDEELLFLTQDQDFVDATHVKFSQGDVTEMFNVARVVGRIKLSELLAN